MLLKNILSYFMIVLLIITGIKRSGNNASGDVWYENLNTLRGLAAVLIVIGHVNNLIKCDSVLLYTISRFAYVIVGYFFFISGIGNAKAYIEKKDTLDTFWRRKVCYILYLSGLTYITYLFIQWIFKIKVFNVTTPFIGLNFVLETNWYIWELTGFYILFWISFRIGGGNGKRLLLIFTTIFMCIIFVENGPAVYYRSALAFPAGVFVGIKKSKMNTGDFDTIKTVKLISGLLFIGLLFAISDIPFLKHVGMPNIICILASIIVFRASTKFYLDGVVLRFLCKYSTEIYLIHFIWLKIAKYYCNSFELGLAFVSIFTIISAVTMSFAIIPVKKVLKK